MNSRYVCMYVRIYTQAFHTVNGDDTVLSDMRKLRFLNPYIYTSLLQVCFESRNSPAVHLKTMTRHI